MLRVEEAVQITDTGRQREANEDSYFARPPLFAVADGMGGAQAGEVASQIAVEAFEGVSSDDDAPPEELLRRTVQDANQEIFDLAEGDSTRSGMGTTLTAALVRGDEISFGHVGDSRAYVYRDGKLKQITNDHSLVEELRRQGRLTRDQAAEHPQRSVITRALGPEPEVQVDTMTFRAQPGDVFLLCSDGLTTMLSDEDLLAILRREGDLDRTARRLVKAANDRGGRDNITVVLFRLESADEEAGAGEEGATLIGPSAEEEGFTADAVRAGAAEHARRRRPAHAESTTASGSKWPRRLLRGGIALLVLALLAFGAIIGARQIWFLGTDDGGRVALYRGLPYELPFGIELYSQQDSIPVTLEALPEDRRGVVTEHELRSEDDAVSLAEDLQNAADAAAAEPPPANGGATNNGGGAQTGGGASGGGSGGGSPGGGGG
jgi:protein phosphatase